MDSDHSVSAQPVFPVAPSPGVVTALTDRERQVVLCAIRGFTNKEIAYELGLADSTVRVLMARAASKFGAHSRKELLEKAAAKLVPRPS
jgi:DNA-binding CsgD family transcriptional regulator